MVPGERQDLSQLLARFLDAAQQLVAANLALARTQLQSKAQEAAHQAAWAATALVPVMVGWGLVCAAAAVGLSVRWGLEVGLLLVGVLNLGAGVLLLVVVKKRSGAARARGRERAGGSDRAAA
ncbi:MAG: phage holin family protein [Deltaproteobacteria bacterium]|nr:phage holin family protein [Deltaproteobacteria bacterium]